MTHSNVPSPDQPVLVDTGERLIPDTVPANETWNYDVHLGRYQYAEQYVKANTHILDYGCGSGYGIHHLAQLTQGQCLGIDKAESIAYAQWRYPAPNLVYKAGDLTLEQTREGKFDLIISFDVIEHVDPIEPYLANIAAQLRDETSIALISTPWSARRQNRLPLHNAHHMVEFTLSEFFACLDPYFTVDEILLNYGMLARLRKKNAYPNRLETMVIPLTGSHLLALEASNEELCTQAENAALTEPAVAALTAWVAAHQQQLGNRSAPATVAAPLRNYKIQRLDRNLALSTTFVAEAENLGAVDLLVSTYQRLNGGHVQCVLEQDGRQVAEITLNTLLMQDHQPQRCLFPSQPDAKGKTFKLTLTAPEATADNAIGIWCTMDGQPVVAPQYRRFRWKGAPRYDVSTEFISGVARLPVFPSAQTHANSMADGLTAWFTQHVAPLPPVAERPWPADAPLLTKLSGSIKHYGLLATVGEMLNYRQWQNRQQK